ncbi:UNVERIFIED_CONTAM: hypothetical protein Slati_1383700 [Sesamum latifolium]|uniref:PORR domain-containing protein n=1 Tax=Sesamum latifolium TaxID=2727402 RepID=A0AAW2X332_9LAMI
MGREGATEKGKGGGRRREDREGKGDGKGEGRGRRREDGEGKGRREGEGRGVRWMLGGEVGDGKGEGWGRRRMLGRGGGRRERGGKGAPAGGWGGKGATGNGGERGTDGASNGGRGQLYIHHFQRRFSLWSMKKEPDLESALSRNRRWMVNNQIKNIILRCPNQVASIDFLQKKFKNLDLQGKALNWLKKYPCCFEVYCDNDEYFCRLTKQMKFLVEEEETVKNLQEPVFVERLAKLLMMSKNQRLNVLKINELKRNFGFPDDYLLRIVPKYSDMFRAVNCTGRRSSMEIELMSWNPDFAISD